MCRENVRVGERTSFGVGGRARWFAEPESIDELVRCVRACRERDLPFFMLGGGTNILFRDESYPGVVIATRRLKRKSVDSVRGQLTFETGVPLSFAIRTAIRHGLSGLETFVGIPGSVGGAVYGNAGGCGIGLGERVDAVEVLQADGQLEWLAASDIDWSYRSSGLGDRVVTRARLSLAGDRVADVRARTQLVMDRKRATQPLSARSAGCVFRNPTGASAGQLIEAAGLKGVREGGAAVSDVHANFIVNEEAATSADVSDLIDRVVRTIRERNAVDLVREIVTPSH